MHGGAVILLAYLVKSFCTNTCIDYTFSFGASNIFLKHEAILKLLFFHKIKTETESENETVTILAVMYLVIYMPCWIVGISCVGTAGGQGTSK